MRVADILRVKGEQNLFTIGPMDALADVVKTMAEKDLGSLIVMEHGELAGILTFREVIQALVRNDGAINDVSVRNAMDDRPLTCSPETELDVVRRMMLESHARYMPIIDNRKLIGVISFYDVAKAVVDAQNFENKMLKAYIRDWPEGKSPEPAAS